MSSNKYQDYKKPHEINGKTIETCEVIKAGYGGTNNNFLLIKFTDGTRQLIGIHAFTYYQPNPSLEEMQKAPSFFSVEDIKLKVEADEIKKRQRANDERERKLREFNKLKEELGA